MQNARSLPDKDNFPHMEEQPRCARPMEVLRNNAVQPFYKVILKRILNKRLRDIVEHEFVEGQQSFRKGRGATDVMFSLRQLVEKNLERHGNTALS